MAIGPKAVQLFLREHDHERPAPPFSSCSEAERGCRTAAPLAETSVPSLGTAGRRARLRYGEQLGQVMHDSQKVPVRGAFAVQI